MGNKAKSKANNADRYKKETSGKRITYNGDVTFKYNGDEVHSSIVDMEVKIPDGKIDSMGTEVSLREANKDDIADYLSDYYNIDVDPDNIKIAKDDEVHIKDGSRYFWKTYENDVDGDMLPCKIPEDVFTRLSKEDQKQFLADGNVVKGEVGDVNENTVTADAKRSYRRKNLEDHVVQRASGTSRRNDTGRSLGKTVQRRRGISEQVLQARGWNGPGSGLTNPEKRLKSNISFSSPNGISVKDEEANKLIKDSFGELSAWLQSKIAKAVDEMATMFVYYGDKDGDTIGRNYSEYNIIRVFKDALNPREGERTLLHELLHNFQAAIENDSNKKDYGMNYITTNHIVNWEKDGVSNDVKDYADRLLNQLKGKKGFTNSWKILVYTKI